MSATPKPWNVYLPYIGLNATISGMNSKTGFSLVELSIVLVILGLLTGGILAGQSLIRASELRSVSTQISAYQSAAHTFRDKYLAIPGDMRNATSFWGTASVGTCPSATGTGTQTCNGDGNGSLSWAATIGDFSEQFMFWQHLANAGLISGSYSGRTGPNSIADIVQGQNVPDAKLGSSSVFLIRHFSALTTTSGSSYPSPYGNMLLLGTDTASNFDGDNTTLTPEEMWSIDMKLDDGRPAYGIILSYINSYRPHCASTDIASTAEYRLNHTVKGCTFLLRLGI